MARFSIRRRDLGRTWNMGTGQLHTFQLTPLQAELIEMEDAHFHHDSAVLLADFEGCNPYEPQGPDKTTGLAVLAACLTHAQDNPQKKLLSAGHTDTSGPDDYNIELSQLRADNVVAALTGDKDGWVDIADQKHKVEDYQQILAWISWLWGWPCDPGDVDGDHGDNTDAAVESFQHLVSEELGQEISVDGDVGPQTWGAIFEVYMLVLADVLGVDAEGLREMQQALTFHDPQSVGCGESFPIEQRGVDGLRSETNRRVELLFFEQREEPELACHASAGSCDMQRCDLYAPGTYQTRYLPCPPIRLEPVQLQVQLTEIAGLYKPGHSDPADIDAGTAKLSGYELGYKSDDDKGRIFINGIPRTDPSVDWQDVRAKNKQYIEVAVEVSATAGGRVPAGARVKWVWEDPDDPSNEAMHAVASGLIDPNDAGVEHGTDNLGERDFPGPNDATGAKYEAIDGYGLNEGADDFSCNTAIVDGVSKVRLHCTNVGGDNFRLLVGLEAHQLVMPGASDATGLMTMWKRIDVEYRQMEDADPLPIGDVPKYFEPCFVQMDIVGPLPADKHEYLADVRAEDGPRSAAYVQGPPTGIFENEGKPGWFLLVAAHRALREVGEATRRRVYKGPARIAEYSYSDGTKSDVIILPVDIDTELAADEDLGSLEIIEGNNKMFFPVWSKDSNKPGPGETRLHTWSLDYQSDFAPGTGLTGRPGQGGAYDRTDDYYARHMMALPARTWTAPGLGFAENVEVEVYTKGGFETAGRSPENAFGGKKYFAGRTIIFTKHPGYHKKGSFDKAYALWVITHELGHAFGFPHKCGYYTWQDPPEYSCAMNYAFSWLYKVGTRDLQRFDTGKSGQHMCARHLHGIRRVHLEDNPALWRW